MGDFNFKITMNVGIPKMSDASKPLEDIMNKIREDSKKNIRVRQASPPGLGGKFRPLAKETIAKKIRKGYPSADKALLAKEIMLRNIVWRKLGKNKYAVLVLGRGSPRRDLVALIHQELGVPSKRGLIARPFLGMSAKTRKFAQYRMNRWVRKKLKETPPKYIKIGLT